MYIEAIKERHSVRTYKEQKIEDETRVLLEKKIQELNEKGNLHLQFMEDADNVYNKLLNKAVGLGSCPFYIACIGKEADDLDERIGYYGQILVLYAQSLGLNTCWVGTFNRKKVKASIADHEKLVITIAIGYGKNQGRVRKSKTFDDVAEVAEVTEAAKSELAGKDQIPAWFRNGVECALLAPTAINQQKFKIRLNSDGKYEIIDKGGIYSKVDLGIVRCNFEIGAGLLNADQL